MLQVYNSSLHTSRSNTFIITTNNQTQQSTNKASNHSTSLFNQIPSNWRFHLEPHSLPQPCFLHACTPSLTLKSLLSLHHPRPHNTSSASSAVLTHSATWVFQSTLATPHQPLLANPPHPRRLSYQSHTDEAVLLLHQHLANPPSLATPRRCLDLFPTDATELGNPASMLL